ncbi:MAG: tetratricopeptide repeat protein [Planctomycetota bacterium]
MASRDAVTKALQVAQSGRLAAALASLRTLQRLHPRDLEVLSVLGLLLTQSGQIEQAIHHLKTAVTVHPSIPGPHSNLANALIHAGRFKEAESHYQAAATADPNYARAFLGLLIARTFLNDLTGALDAAERALALKPDWPELSPNYARALAAADRPADAVEHLETAVRRHPTLAPLRSSLLMALNYLERPAADIAAAHRDYSACVTAAADPPPSDRSPERPLRIGILSGDLTTHAVGFFADAIFRHPPTDWHLTAFSTSGARAGDGAAKEFRRMAHAWCDAPTLSDAALDAAIRAARIDILIDLGAHTSGGRLTALDRKPAPIIATAIGYPNTTGHPHIDLRIVDSTTDPRDSDSLCTERLVRIDPCFLCYRPPTEAPAPALPPADAPITFGSFNLLSKISRTTLTLWRDTLAAVPHSRLLLKSKSFADPTAQSNFLARARAAGMDTTRIEIIGFTDSIADHLALYQRIHIALDTTPYNGTTTTCEALWMGVPVITLLGDRHCARVGASLLRAANLPHLVAANAAQFTELSAQLAADRSQLALLRDNLRGTLGASALLDAPSWAARFFGAMRDAWRNHCSAKAS